MSDYNGFTNDERVKGGRIQTWAYRRGYLVRPLNCSACKVYGDVPGQQIAHLEDYTEPIKGSIFLCHRCHSMVHLRGTYPGEWNTYRDLIREGHVWAKSQSKWKVIAENCKPMLDPTVLCMSEMNEPRDFTILDEIHDGIHHPGPRKVWAEKMAKIMNNERVFWIPTQQMSLI